MASVNDIAVVDVGEEGPSVLFDADALTVSVTQPSNVSMVEITVPDDISTLTVETPGVQGPPGVQNLFVSDTAPADPEIGWVWIKP
jgi:hypothetical protein